MKHITLFLLALFCVLPLYAETFKEFRNRRVKELIDDGHNKRDAMKIAMKEWRNRDKDDVEDNSSNSGTSDSDSSDSPSGDDLDVLEEEWTKKLSREGLTEKDLSNRVKEEMKIQKKLVKLSGEARNDESDKLHRKEAKKIITKLRLLKDYPDDYADKLVDLWEKWFWKSDVGRKNYLTEERDDLEKKEISDRQRTAKKVREQIHKELKAYWVSKGLHQGHKAHAHFSSAWQVLVDVPRRLYSKEKAATKLTLKRNGFDSKATSIFFGGMDSLFE